jgi:serine/threonine protein kinase
VFFYTLKENPLVMKEFVRKMVQTIDFLQQENVIHCDLKPDNVLIQ